MNSDENKKFKLKDLFDNSSKYSTVRWAFVSTTIATISLVVGAVICYVVSSMLAQIFGFVPPLDVAFLGQVALLAGVIQGISTVGKAVQDGCSTKEKLAEEVKK